MMHIVGGLYRELCEVPHWDAVFGSGGRAACAVQGVASSVTLCTYAKNPAAAASRFAETSVVVEAQRSRSDIVFSYFHPLSEPHIEPSRAGIAQEDPLRVAATVVLRFGLLEGDAIVEADTAVYDPQTHLSPSQFAANGSHAKRLALVLNEGEVQAMSGTNDTVKGSQQVLQQAQAEVIVVKRGARGALVVERGRSVEAIPAYRSTQVFKIGTGDVFSGAFAAFWGEKGFSAAEAADQASRMVARYAATRLLPVTPGESLNALSSDTARGIRVIGLGNTLSRRYVLEEAKYCLEKLGAESVAIEMTDDPGSVVDGNDTVLIVADGYFEPAWRHVDAVISSLGRPALIFADDPANVSYWAQPKSNLIMCSDFTTSLYETLWTAMGPSART